jgi:hypothetical protein
VWFILRCLLRRPFGLCIRTANISGSVRTKGSRGTICIDRFFLFLFQGVWIGAISLAFFFPLTFLAIPCYFLLGKLKTWANEQNLKDTIGQLIPGRGDQHGKYVVQQCADIHPNRKAIIKHFVGGPEICAPAECQIITALANGSDDNELS